MGWSGVVEGEDAERVLFCFVVCGEGRQALIVEIEGMTLVDCR